MKNILCILLLIPCIAMSQHVMNFTIPDCPTGIHLLRGGQNWIVYPQPFDDEFIVDFINMPPNEYVFIALFNTEGVNVFNDNFSLEKVMKINMRHFPDGVYYLRIKTGQELFQTKLIKIDQ